MFLESADGKIGLRAITEDDASGNYLQFMNDPEVTKYLESRYTPWSEESLKAYIRKMNADPNTVFLAIEYGSEYGSKWCKKVHCGNVKLVVNSLRHRFGEVSIVLAKDYQGQHIGSTALKLVKDWAFHTLCLHKVWAGILSPHTASIKAFENAGFVEEARLKSQYLVDNEYVDDVIMAAWNPAHKI